MIVPVTDRLAEELVTTEAFIEKLKSERVNDRTHYGSIVARLESLALALLSTGSAGSLLVPKRDGARLNLGPNTRLSGELSETASYLGDTAARLLSRGTLNEFSTLNAEAAMAHLKSLFGLTGTAIRRQAEEDLHAIREGGVSGLLAVAHTLARTADSPAGSHVDIPAERITVKNPAGETVVDTWPQGSTVRVKRRATAPTTSASSAGDVDDSLIPE
jgi:hypothetical protein